MRRLPFLLLAVLLLLVGCFAGGVPRAVAAETRFDFGNVPVSSDMKDAKLKQFLIKNEGTGSLRLRDLQVKTLEGC